MRKPTGRPNGRPKGIPTSPETKEHLRQIALKRWQDPAYRAAHLPRLLGERNRANLAAATAIHVRKCAERRQNRPPPKPVGRPRVLPPKGTPEFRQYMKIARVLGAAAARTIDWSAETEGAGRP